jgi:hypothetical protein
MRSLVHLRDSDYRVMPWKNGLGSTTELYVDPPDAGLDDFVWRVSIATLTTSGPFSRFEGCDRIITQLEGAPMRLTHDAGAPQMLAPLTPHAFAGEADTCATLTSPARDFNVMTRRARMHATVTTRALGAHETSTCDAATVCIYVVRGSLMLVEHTLAIVSGETCVTAGEGVVVLCAGEEGATALVVALHVATTREREPPRGATTMC